MKKVLYSDNMKLLLQSNYFYNEKKSNQIVNVQYDNVMYILFL